jgi:hypothetical protein
MTPTTTAIAALVILECAALATGHNGTLLRLVIVAVAGLGGFSLAKFLELRNPPPPPDDLNR